MSPLVLCADDFGLSEEVDRGILHLLALRRVSAVSCLVNGPAWAADAPALARVTATAGAAVSLGLHFNLTEGQPLHSASGFRPSSLPSMAGLVARAHLRLLPAAALDAELDAQWRAFEAGLQRPPDHLDGHQHVHHLPQVRAAIQRWLATRPGLPVRCTGRALGPGATFKRAVLAATGGRQFDRWLHAHGHAANTVLLGAYDFVEPDYRSLMRAWLRQVPIAGALLFCHPGDCAAGDVIGPARERELAYFASNNFVADLAEAGAQLVPRLRFTA